MHTKEGIVVHLDYAQKEEEVSLAAYTATTELQVDSGVGEPKDQFLESVFTAISLVVGFNTIAYSILKVLWKYTK